jgi:hypothetical protein
LGIDPRGIAVGVTWLKDGWCLGEFQAQTTETASGLRLGSVIEREYSHGGGCAGVGTVYNTAWADVTLNAPLGDRLVVRSSDGAELPVLAREDQFIRKHPVSADIKQYGGLNDNPPLGLRKAIHITDSTALENLAMQLDSLPPYPTGIFNCPLDDGSYYLIDLNYAVGGDTSLKINAKGCQAVYVGESKKPVAWTLQAPTSIFGLLAELLAE